MKERPKMVKAVCRMCGKELEIEAAPKREYYCEKCLKLRRQDEESTSILAQKRAEHHTRQWVKKVISPKTRTAGGKWHGKS